MTVEGRITLFAGYTGPIAENKVLVNGDAELYRSAHSICWI